LKSATIFSMSIVQKFTFNPFQENTYIIYDETKACVIIDPGCYDPFEQQVLTRFISEKQLEPVHLLNTHCHIDHVVGNQFVAAAYNLKLSAHPEDNYNLERLVEVGQRYGVPVAPSPPIEIDLYHGAVVQFGNTSLQVLFTPGHSKGSVSFYNIADEYIVAGDVLFRGSIGRTDLPGGDFTVLENSIREVLYQLPDNTVVYPGHEDDTTIGYEKRNNPFVKI
jgi:hydroxyacylglutathione hydrolase